MHINPETVKPLAEVKRTGHCHGEALNKAEQQAKLDAEKLLVEAESGQERGSDESGLVWFWRA